MNRKKLPLFYKIYIPVVAFFIIVIIVGTFIINGLLAEYESIHPKNEADRIFEKYYNDRGFDALAELCKDSYPLETSGNIANYLRENYGNTEEMSCTSGSKRDGLFTYIVKLGDYKISSFTLKERSERSKHGWTMYEEGDFRLFLKTESVSVIAPAGYSVAVNSTELFDGYISEKDLPGEGDNLLPKGVEGVKYTKYTIDGLLADPEITAKAPDGQVSEVKLDKNEDVYRAALLHDEALKTAHGEYALKAAQEYSKYMQDDQWWGGISQYFDPESDIYESTRTSLTMFVMDHDGFRFDDVFVGEFYGYSDDVFSCRISFTHVLTDRGNEYKDYFDSTIFFRNVDGTYKICGMINNA